MGAYTSLQVADQVEVIRSKFGFDPAIVAFALKGAVEKRQAANTEFLAPRERRALTTPHDLVRRFFDALVSAGFLEKQTYRAEYTVVDTREHNRRGQIEQRQREYLRKREREIKTAEHRRHCENLLEGFLSQRVTHVRECMRCMALAKKHSTHCPICSGQALADTQLTDEVIERYREKLIT